MTAKQLIGWVAGCVAFTMALVACAGGDGALTETRSTLGNVRKVRLSWVNPTNWVSGTTKTLSGTIQKVTFVPTARITPTIYLIDENGQDILCGLGTAIASNSVTVSCPGISRVAAVTGSITNAIVPQVTASTLTCIVTNTGASSGYFDVYYIGDP
jgi:hypothetical protein